MVTKPPNPKTTKSKPKRKPKHQVAPSATNNTSTNTYVWKRKPKPKRKPREWIRYALVKDDGFPSDVLWEKVQTIWKVRGYEYIKVKVREVIE